MRFDDRVVIVTGGGKGIGAAYVTAFAAAGAAVVVADIDGAAASAVAAAVTAGGGQAVACTVDVSDPDSVAAMARTARERCGGIDVLVNNAALYAALPRRAWDEIPVAEFDQVLAVNLKGTWLCCRAVVPYMKERGKGKIINIGSSSVFTGGHRQSHYLASKAGVLGLTRAIAREVGDFNICVNTLTPGLTDSGTNRATTGAGVFQAQAARGCIKRVEEPGDIVGAVLFLASDAADFITGQTLNVDGGRNFH